MTLIRNTIYSLSSTVHTSHVPVIAVVVLPPRNSDGDFFYALRWLRARDDVTVPGLPFETGVKVQIPEEISP